MIKRIIYLLRKNLKLFFIKLHLVSPDNEKPASIDHITWERFYSLSTHINYILEKFDSNEFKDLYIGEAGLGNGNTFLYLTLIAEKLGLKIIGFDSFEGFPEIKNIKDRRLFGKPLKKGQWAVSTVKSIKRKLINSGVNPSFIDKKVELVPGYFEDSLKNFDKNKKFIFLHLDVDLYSSYKTCLGELWDNVVSGGIVVFDEYHDKKWPDAKDAIDEFFNKKKITVSMDKLTRRGFVIKKSSKFL